MTDPLASIRKEFDLNQQVFKAIVDGFKAEYESGLSTASASGLATMIPSYVTTLPTGKEKGTYLALDLGGSTLRVCAVELLGNCEVTVTEVRRHIAPNDPLRTSGATAFFDWIVDAIAELIEKIGYDAVHADGPLSLGVCWSFPVEYVQRDMRFNQIHDSSMCFFSLVKQAFLQAEFFVWERDSRLKGSKAMISLLCSRRRLSAR